MRVPRQYPGLKKARLIMAQLRVLGVEFPLFYAGGSNEATPFWTLPPSELRYWWPALADYIDHNGGINE